MTKSFLDGFFRNGIALCAMTTALSVPAAETFRASVDDFGGEVTDESWIITNRALSANGRWLVFAGRSDDLFPGDANGEGDAFVLDMWTGELEIVSVASDGTQGNNQSALLMEPAISANGRFVTFVAHSDNLVADDTNDAEDVFLHDRETGETIRVSVASDGTQAEAGIFAGIEPSLSTDGRYIAFSSFAENLVPDDGNGDQDVFVHDRLTGETMLVSRDASGAIVDGTNANPTISADGRLVAFSSFSQTLVADDSNGQFDIFVKDLATGDVERVSIASNGGEADDRSDFPVFSSNGRFVGFSSEANNLVDGDLFTGSRDLFYHDRQSHETALINVNNFDGGDAVAEGIAFSADGHLIAYGSGRNTLAGAVGFQIRLLDTTSLRPRTVSRNTEGRPGNANSFLPSLSADGRILVFQSWADNLVSDDTNGVRDIFVRDRLLDLSRSAEISVAVDASSDVAQTGNEIAYTVTVNNSGPDTARALSLTSVFSTNSTVLSASTSRGECNTAIVTVCDLRNLLAGQSTTVNFIVRASESGELEHQATATAGPIEVDYADNMVTHLATVAD